MTIGFARLFPPCFRYPIVLPSRPAVLLDRRSTFGRWRLRGGLCWTRPHNARQGRADPFRIFGF